MGLPASMQSDMASSSLRALNCSTQCIRMALRCQEPSAFMAGSAACAAAIALSSHALASTLLEDCNQRVHCIHLVSVSCGRQLVQGNVVGIVAREGRTADAHPWPAHSAS